MEHACTKFSKDRIRVIGIPGNDDPWDFDEILNTYPFVENVDGQAIEIARRLWVVGLGGSNVTPWLTYPRSRFLSACNRLSR